TCTESSGQLSVVVGQWIAAGSLGSDSSPLTLNRLVLTFGFVITLTDINDARSRIAGSAVRTPLVRLNVDDAPAEIYLKLENLQPIGSFKIRGAANAMSLMSPEVLSRGVLTASA